MDYTPEQELRYQEIDNKIVAFLNRKIRKFRQFSVEYLEESKKNILNFCDVYLRIRRQIDERNNKK